MININDYILEKLYISKDYKVNPHAVSLETMYDFIKDTVDDSDTLTAFKKWADNAKTFNMYSTFNPEKCKKYLIDIKEKYHNLIKFSKSTCDYLDKEKSAFGLVARNRLKKISSYTKDEFFNLFFGGSSLAYPSIYIVKAE